MPRADDWDDEEGEEDAWDDDEDEPRVPCPYCHREIHEDAQRCPYCEHYISAEDAPAARKPWWVIVGVILALYIVLRWVMG